MTCRFNQYFQTQQVVITDLHDKIIILYQDILLCFLKRDYVMQTPLDQINPKNGEKLLTDRQLYLGAQVIEHIDDPCIVAQSARRKEFFDRLN